MNCSTAAAYLSRLPSFFCNVDFEDEDLDEDFDEDFDDDFDDEELDDLVSPSLSVTVETTSDELLEEVDRSALKSLTDGLEVVPPTWNETAR